MRNARVILVSVLAPLTHVDRAEAAPASYAVIDLHPLDARYERQLSSALGSSPSGSYQVGVANYFVGADGPPLTQRHAVMWSGDQGSFVDLHPPGWDYTEAFGVDGGWQVGRGAAAIGDTRAVVWSGTATSFVDITPPGVARAEASGVSGQQIVGHVEGRFDVDGQFQIARHAAMWVGAQHAYVDMNPSGARGSQIFGTDGTHQVGMAGGGIVPPGSGAVMWSGTPDSVVSLGPLGWTQTFAVGVRNGVQVGYGWSEATGNLDHAMMWRGTQESTVLLNPPGYRASQALATNGLQQVGWGGPDGGGNLALLWNGSATDYVNLSSFLPPGYSAGIAYGIDDNGNVFGSAASPDGSAHAIMWVAIPEPSAIIAEGSVLLLLLARGRATFRPR